MNIKFKDGIYGGWSSLGSMTPEAEQALLADNEARMKRLYPGSLHDDLLLLRRRGFVVCWRKPTTTLWVGDREMTVAEFVALAARERARLLHDTPEAQQPLSAMPWALAAE